MRRGSPLGQYSETLTVAASPGRPVCFMYFLEVTDKASNDANWPDLAQEMPCVIVKVGR